MSAESPPASSMVTPADLAAGGAIERTTLCAPVLADSAGVNARVGGRERLERLLLGAHDRLDGRKPRRVDRVRDRDDRGQRRLDDVVAVLGLALGPDRRAVDRQVGHLRHDRPLEVVGDGRGHDVAVGVGGLLAEQHEVGVLLAEDRGEHVRRPGDVGAGERRVGHEHGPVGAQRERLLERALRRRRAHADRDDLGDVCAALADPHGLLERVQVERIELGVARPVEPVRRRVEPLVRRPARHLLHAHCDVHRACTSIP